MEGNGRKEFGKLEHEPNGPTGRMMSTTDTSRR